MQIAHNLVVMNVLHQLQIFHPARHQPNVSASSQALCQTAPKRVKLLSCGHLSVGPGDKHNI